MDQGKLSLTDVGRMLHEFLKVFRKRAEESMYEDIMITTEQLGLLHALSIKSEEVIQKDMAEMMGKDKSTILRLIDTLEERELVRRVTDLEDRRKNFLMVTKLGTRVLAHYTEISNTLMKELEEGLSQEELLIFQKVMSHVTQKVRSL